MEKSPVMEFEDRLLKALPDPDEVGTSEYSLLYEHAQDVIQSANIGGDDVASLMLSSLDEVADEVGRFRAATLSAMGVEDPRRARDGGTEAERGDWRYEVNNGDTVLGLGEWLAHQREMHGNDPLAQL